MGFFDFIFGRKKEQAEPEPMPESLAEQKDEPSTQDTVADGLNSYFMELSCKEIVIGVGQSGNSILKSVKENGTIDADLVLVHFDYPHINTLIENCILLNELDTCGTTLLHDTERYLTDSNIYKNLVERYQKYLVPIIEANPARIIITPGLGGGNGYGTVALIKFFVEKQISVVPVVSLPFKWEGNEKYERAIDALKQIIELAPHAITLDLESLKEKLSNSTSLNIFPEVDIQMSNRVKEAVEKSWMDIKPLEVDSIEQNKKLDMSENDKVTPYHIDRLKDNEIFVFGSNLAGQHCAGAAHIACQKFGAIMGQGVGLQGQTYAIPTMQGGVETIKPYVDDFVKFAKDHTEYHFFVTRIGCGIAGFKDEDIAPLFAECLGMSNVSLPKSFINVLQNSSDSRPDKLEMYGQVRTIVDIVKYINSQTPITTYDELSSALSSAEDQLRTNVVPCGIWDILRADGNMNKIFSQGRFNPEVFSDTILKGTQCFQPKGMDLIVYKRGVAKLLKIIRLMCEVKDYHSSEELLADFQRFVVSQAGSCGNPGVFVDNPMYPAHFLYLCMKKHGAELLRGGRLDVDLLEEIVFKKHARGVRKYGLNAVIAHDYAIDTPCHPEAYFPKDTGTGPVYVKNDYGVWEKSCGEGKGPNKVSELYEWELCIQSLVDTIPEYKKVKYRDNTYVVNVKDSSKPIFDSYWGKVVLDDKNAHMSLWQHLTMLTSK